jgi:hypothetical protein
MPTIDEILASQSIESLSEPDIERVLGDDATAMKLVRHSETVLHVDGDRLDVSTVRRRTFDTLDLDAYELTFTISFVVTPSVNEEPERDETESTSENWGLKAGE